MRAYSKPVSYTHLDVYKRQEINSVELESLMKKLTIEVGLVPTKHHFEIDGVCANCQTEA